MERMRSALARLRWAWATAKWLWGYPSLADPRMRGWENRALIFARHDAKRPRLEDFGQRSETPAPPGAGGLRGEGSTGKWD